MEKLKQDWITDGWIDFEYKKYVLLAYLKHVKRQFGRALLYPQLADLFRHYNNLKRLQENKQLMADRFPKELSQLDIQKLQATYQHIINDDELMQEINELIQYALPQFKQVMNDGKEIYDFVEENLTIDTVGVVPIYDKEGYIFITEDNRSDVKVFQYEVSIFESANERYRSLKTRYIKDEKRGLAQTVEQIKLGLIRKFKELPNPATYLITSKLEFPVVETILPITKRLLIQRLQA